MLDKKILSLSCFYFPYSLESSYKLFRYACDTTIKLAVIFLVKLTKVILTHNFEDPIDVTVTLHAFRQVSRTLNLCMK